MYCAYNFSAIPGPAFANTTKNIYGSYQNSFYLQQEYFFSYTIQKNTDKIYSVTLKAK